DARNRERPADAPAPELDRIGRPALAGPDRVSAGEVVAHLPGRAGERRGADRLRIPLHARQGLARLALPLVLAHVATPVAAEPTASRELRHRGAGLAAPEPRCRNAPSGRALTTSGRKPG